MQKSTLSIVLLFFCILNTYAEKPKKIKFGKLSNEEIAMTLYEQDSTADAVILFDIGKSSFSYTQGKGFTLTFERHVRIKFFNQEALEHAKFDVRCYDNGKGDEEDFHSLKAYTFNIENGKVIDQIKFSKKDIIEEEISEHWTANKFTLPQVKAGSIIDVTYKVTSPFAYNLEKWYFQQDIPVAYSEYITKIPEYYNYSTKMKGYLNIQHEEGYNTQRLSLSSTTRQDNGVITKSSTSYQMVDYQENFKKFYASHIPAFQKEAYLTTARNYLTSVSFELNFVQWPNQPIERYSSTWESTNERLLDASNFGKQLKTNPLSKEVKAILTITGDDLTKRMSAIYTLVQSKTHWNGDYSLYSNSIRKTLLEKKGSVADINLLLTATLKNAGINAYPVILSTRNHGRTTYGTPQLSEFNYVITMVKIGENTFLLDATNDFLIPGQLPERCLNYEGRIIDKKIGNWINLTPRKISRRSSMFTATINPEAENINGSFSTSFTQQFAIKKRNEINSYSDEASYWDNLKEQYSGLTLEDGKINNLDNLSKSVSNKANFNLDGYIENMDDMIVLKQIPNGMEENPFKLEKRDYPVEYAFPKEETTITQYMIPEGFTIEELPENTAIALPNKSGKYIFNITQNGNMIQIVNKLAIKKTIFLPEEYAALKNFYDMVISKQEESIVLVKE